MADYSYKYANNLYLNITNRCMMACPYCIKHKWVGKFRGNSLRLDKEPTVKQVIESIGDPTQYGEIIFCGYGDALIRLPEVIEISKWLKSKNVRVRINTAGLANRYYGKNILPELKGLIDVISISLNKLNNPMFKEESFNEILKFAKAAKDYIPTVVVTAVELPGLDVSKIKEVVKPLGVHFRIRPYLDEYEEY